MLVCVCVCVCIYVCVRVCAGVCVCGSKMISRLEYCLVCRRRAKQQVAFFCEADFTAHIHFHFHFTIVNLGGKLICFGLCRCAMQKEICIAHPFAKIANSRLAIFISFFHHVISSVMSRLFIANSQLAAFILFTVREI